MVAWGTVALAQLRVLRGELTHYRSSPPALRGFCASCGTGITYRHTHRPQEVDVALATLDEPQRLAPAAHVWVADKVPWLPITDGLPQFDGGMPAPA
jgi:hypothetical protein